MAHLNIEWKAMDWGPWVTKGHCIDLDKLQIDEALVESVVRYLETVKKDPASALAMLVAAKEKEYEKAKDAERKLGLYEDVWLRTDKGLTTKHKVAIALIVIGALALLPM